MREGLESRAYSWYHELDHNHLLLITRPLPLDPQGRCVHIDIKKGTASAQRRMAAYGKIRQLTPAVLAPKPSSMGKFRRGRPQTSALAEGETIEMLGDGSSSHAATGSIPPLLIAASRS